MVGARIALIGRSGAGKSEVSRYLTEAHKFKAVRTGQICRTIATLLFGNEEKTSTQRLDDVLTLLDPCIFLRASLREADLSGNVVVDALRFAADLELVKELGFKSLRVTCPDQMRIQQLTFRGQSFDLEVEGGHRSETELDSFLTDFHVANTGTDRKSVV